MTRWYGKSGVGVISWPGMGVYLFNLIEQVAQRLFGELIATHCAELRPVVRGVHKLILRKVNVEVK